MESNEFIEVSYEIEGFVYLLVWHEARLVFWGGAEQDPAGQAQHQLEVLRRGDHEMANVQEAFDRYGEPDVETHHGKFTFTNSRVNKRFADYRPDPAGHLFFQLSRKSYPRYTWLTTDRLDFQPVLAREDDEST